MSKNGNNSVVQDPSEEGEMPRLSRLAARRAFRNVLKSGNSVLVARNGGIYQAHPDGTFEFIKKTQPDIKTEKGMIIKIK